MVTVLKGAVVKKRAILSVGLTVLVGAAVLLQCANPVDEPPLRWRSNVEAPLTNEHFMIGEVITHSSFDENGTIVGKDVGSTSIILVQFEKSGLKKLVENIE